MLEEGVLSKELITVAPVDAQLQIIDRVLQANWGSESLERPGEDPGGDNDWKLEVGCLFYKTSGPREYVSSTKFIIKFIIRPLRRTQVERQIFDIIGQAGVRV
jgi:hypothetical protein